MRVLLLLLFASTVYAGGGDFSDKYMMQQQILDKAYYEVVPQKVLKEAITIAPPQDEDPPREPDWVDVLFVKVRVYVPDMVLVPSLILGLIGFPFAAVAFKKFVERTVTTLLDKGGWERRK